jgi:nucleolar protein 56
LDKSADVLLFEVGLVVLDDVGKLIHSRKFVQPSTAYHSLSLRENGELTEIVPLLRKFYSVRVSHSILLDILSKEGFRVNLLAESEQDALNKNKLDLVTKYGLCENRIEAIKELQQFATDYSSIRIKLTSESLDLHVGQAVNGLDEIDETINTIGTRMREWYGLHFPELDNLLQNVTTYAFIVKSAGPRENITKDILFQADLQENKIQLIMNMASKSRGGDLAAESSQILQKLASEVIELSKLREALSETIETVMEDIAPNIKKMLTPVIAARLIARAGSLRKLAFLPASTIQILGAEKALFRALKTGARPPKHGLLFQHPAVHSAPKWQRGRIARALASKIAIFARIDLYRHAPAEDELMSRLNKRIETIQKSPQKFGSKYDTGLRSDDKRRRDGNFGRRDTGDRWKKKKGYDKRRNRFGRREH